LDIINLDQLRIAFQTGGLRAIGLAASGGLFFVTAQVRNSGGWVVLATTRGKQARGFRDPAKAILLLHEIGVQKIAVDVSGWVPGRAAEERKRRPDVSVRQRKVHGVAKLVAGLGGGRESSGRGDGS